jgi:hypothetical protein
VARSMLGVRASKPAKPGTNIMLPVS